MYFFDSFIITQRTFYMVLGFIVLFLGTILNFALAGLFQKKSQKFSNIVTISTLIISAICLLPFVLGFLNPHSVSSIYFFNKNIAFGGLEILLCIISQITVLAAFLISKKQLGKMRFKQHYFNSLYLCSAFSLNFLIISKGFIPFILSLEILSICTFYIMQASKTRADFYSTYKYISFSLYATIAMIFAYALSCGFSINSGILPVIAKGISTGQLSVVVSVDSSSKEIYKKIKQTDKYETVCKNLKKYAKSQRGSYNVISKYIIIPEINDNTVEIDNWLKFNKDNNIGIIVIDIENSWLNRYRKEEPDKRIIDLMKYVAAKSKEMNFYRLEICDRAKYLI